jgi:hypothetical protein
MARLGGAEIRNLAFDPGVGILALNVGAYRRNQVAYLPHAPLRRAKVEPELVRE